MGIRRFDQEKENRQVLLSFAKSIQERDIVTYEHSRRVGTYAQRLARYLGWSRSEARDLALAALVHDLGKTWIANDILMNIKQLRLSVVSNKWDDHDIARMGDYFNDWWKENLSLCRVSDMLPRSSITDVMDLVEGHFLQLVSP